MIILSVGGWVSLAIVIILIAMLLIAIELIKLTKGFNNARCDKTGESGNEAESDGQDD